MGLSYNIYIMYVFIDDIINITLYDKYNKV